MYLKSQMPTSLPTHANANVHPVCTHVNKPQLHHTWGINASVRVRAIPELTQLIINWWVVKVFKASPMEIFGYHCFCAILWVHTVLRLDMFSICLLNATSSFIFSNNWALYCVCVYVYTKNNAFILFSWKYAFKNSWSNIVWYKKLQQLSFYSTGALLSEKVWGF